MKHSFLRKHSVVFFLGIFVMFPLFVFALTDISSTYRSDKGTRLLAYNQGVENNGNTSYFVPTKTQVEFNAFTAAAGRLDGVNICDKQDGNWGDFGGCSETCGGGTKTRACDSPSALCGGAGCAGSNSETCNTQACWSGPRWRME
jgi:hypothetical protein